MAMRKKAKNTLTRLYGIARFSDLHGTRFLLAVAELLWGFTLLLPGDTISRPTYKVMVSIMPELAWALAFLTMAYFQIKILMGGDYHSRLAVWFAAFNCSFWAFVCISMALSVSPFPSAVSGEFALALGASWVWIRSGGKNTHLDRRACNA